LLIFAALAGACCLPDGAAAQPFFLVATVTPPGSGSPSHDVMRFALAGSGAAEVTQPPILASLVNDPAHALFRARDDLLVANRHGNSGAGSISRFRLNTDGSYTQLATITGNGLANVHQVDVNPITGELFAVCIGLGGRLSRFTFGLDGSAVPNGTVSTGLSGLRGVALRRTGTELVAVSQNEGLRRFTIEPDGSLTLLQSLTGHAGSGAHYAKFLREELYVGQIGWNRVARYRYDQNGHMYLHQTIPCAGGPLDVAFSEDEQEMFVAKHFSGGIDRFQYNPTLDTWVYFGAIATPHMGGIATTYSPRVLGDVNRDGQVNLMDFLLLAAAYDSVLGDPAYNPDADFNGDYAVDLQDFLILAANYDR
jgi:6-phosphogluconolactonase (cycloisomerase 2 family)